MKTLLKNPVAATYLIFIGLSNFAISFTFTIYSLFLTKNGMSLLEINIINGFFMAFNVFFEMPTGSFADRVGRHHSLTVSCLLISTSCLIYFFSHSFWLFVIAEIIGAAGETFSSGAGDAWLADSLKKRGEFTLKEKVFRQKQSSRMIGLIIGCLSGAMLGEIDLSLPWLAASVFMFLLGVLSFIFMKENYSAEMERDQKSNLKTQVKTAWTLGVKNKALLYIMVFGGLFTFSVQALNMQWSVLFKNYYALSQTQLGYLFIGTSISVALGAKLSQKIAKKIKDERLAMVVPQLFTAIAIITCSLLSNYLLVLGTFLAHELGRGFFAPLQQNYMNNRLESKTRATLLSLDSMFAKLGALLGLLISGLIANSVSIQAAWLFSGTFLAITILVFIIKTKKP